MRLSIVLVTLALTGCALSPEQIPTSSTQTLCRFYSAPLNDNYLNPAIKAELVKRGEADCTDPALIALRNQQSMQMMQMGTSLMQNATPRPAPMLAAPPVNCSSTVQGNSVNTQCW